jgi:ABC-type multidrug transport system fused ATPase/permease subunit
MAVLLLVALATHWLATLQCLIPLAVIWYVLQRHQQQSGTSQALAQARADQELRLLAESLRKTRLVRGYGMEGFEHERFQTHLDRFRQKISTVQRGERLARWGARLLIAVGVAIVLFLVGIKVLYTGPSGAAAPSPGLTLSGALLLWAAFAAMVRPLDGLAGLRRSRAGGAQAADRIDRYLERIPEVGQAVGAKFLQPLSKSIQYEAVRYSLPHRRVLLDGFDLKIPAGSTTAFISLDPLESRAAAYLLPRFIEPQAGRLLLDGEDVAWVTLESLRAETVYVGGADPFFTGTVRENIAGGDPKYSLQEITEAAKQMHANKFILRLSQGYETALGEHGEQLDAGQGFRLGLTRALLRNPAMLILEEPADTLDDDTKALLDDAYGRLARDRTLIFLPTRLSTVKRADRVVLIHRGRVEAVGHHADLVRSSPLYRHWEYIRFNQFRQDGGEGE